MSLPDDTAAPPSPIGVDAFEAHVVPRISMLARVARALTDQPADADDLVQDTLIRAFRGVRGFDGRNPNAWLLTILRNTHINRNRRRRPELSRDGDVTVLELRAAWAPAADAMINDRFDAEVARALAALDRGFRDVVQLVDIEGLTCPEAAVVLGIPAGTVMSRLHRARRRIRDHLDRAAVAPRSA